VQECDSGSAESLRDALEQKRGLCDAGGSLHIYERHSAGCYPKMCLKILMHPFNMDKVKKFDFSR
jgi:hypothetical protein